ncbi:MAG: hypothetical protein FJY39_10570 [Betaproteobacteria bacterium]|nr:hypothetical protein [Betaproteobacteria bacterium]
MKRSLYWERIRFEGAIQSSMYIVVNSGKLVMATSSLDLARQTFRRVKHNQGIDELVSEKREPTINPAG